MAYFRAQSRGDTLPFLPPHFSSRHSSIILWRAQGREERRKSSRVGERMRCIPFPSHQKADAAKAQGEKVDEIFFAEVHL